MFNDRQPDNNQENEVIQEETQTQETLQALDANPEKQPSDSQNNPQKQPSDVENNFIALRKKAQRVERERDEAMRRLAEYEASKQPQPQAADEDLDFGLDQDAIAEGKHLNKMIKKMKQLENQLKEQEQRTSMGIVEAQIKSKYPDFDNVVSSDNIAMLREQYPELAQTLNTSSDLYSKAVSAYTLIKKLGITPEDQALYKADAARVQSNMAKPRPLVSGAARSSGDAGALSHANAFANGLTDDLKKQLWKEMNEYRR